MFFSSLNLWVTLVLHILIMIDLPLMRLCQCSWKNHSACDVVHYFLESLTLILMGNCCDWSSVLVFDQNLAYFNLDKPFVSCWFQLFIHKHILTVKISALILFNLYCNTIYWFGHIHQVTYHFFHWKKGTPFAEDQGIYNALTWWEQMDNGKQLTRNRKFLTVVPVVLWVVF